MRQIRWVFFLVITAIMTVFALSNLIPLRVNFLFFYAWVNLLVLLAVTFGLGLLVGGILGLWHDHSARKLPSPVRSPNQ